MIEREIKFFKRGRDGKYIQPDKNSPDLETVMDHNRQRAANQFQLADEHGCGDGHTYDPKGNNVCQDCNQYLAGENDCEVIEDIVPGPDGDINPKASSCRHYEGKRAGDWEVRMKRTTKEAALFGTAKNGEGFGCGSKQKQRCGWRETSKWEDSLRRGEWCGAMYFTTTPTTCCAINSTPTIEDDYDEDEDDDDDDMDDKDDSEEPEESSMSEYMRRKRRA